MTHFDGNGNLAQTDNIHGSISGFSSPDRAGTGAYTINADCTGTMKLVNEHAPTLTLRVVVVDAGLRKLGGRNPLHRINTELIQYPVQRTND